jgi:hypothetical protein
VKTGLRNLKVPFGTAKFSKIKNVRYLSWEDAFDVEFADGLCILEPHANIRRANKISPQATFVSLESEDWCQGGFYVHYDTGEVAEVSWSFIRELPPAQPSTVAEAPAKYTARRKKRVTSSS